MHRFCPPAKLAVPRSVPKREKLKADAADWKDPTWVCLKFIVDDAQRCQYTYESNGKTGEAATYTATATCDPDGNGKMVKVVLKGKGGAAGDAERVSLTVDGE